MKGFRNSAVCSGLLFGLTLSAFTSQAFAQDATPTAVATLSSTTLSSEGISGDIDKHRRGPVINVTTQVDSQVAKLLVDTEIPNSEFQKYPVKVDFYINRHLFSSQIRSVELPGPLGVDIGQDIATPPFNYTIVATILHPNRQYTSVIQGAVFASNLATTVDCTLSLSDSTSEAPVNEDFVANAVKTLQSGNDGFTFSFESSNVDTEGSGVTVTLSGAATVQDLAATGSLTISRDGASPTTTQVTGTVEKTGEALNSFSLDSEDGSVSLSCS